MNTIALRRWLGTRFSGTDYGRLGGRRRGAVLVWFAILVTGLLGMVGLVIDTGLLLAAHRQVQNATDAAALAFADDLLRGESVATSTVRATDYVRLYNGLSSAPAPTIRTPLSGPYAGDSAYSEVVVSAPLNVFFLQTLGLSRNHTVQARAVVGRESVPLSVGMVALNPNDSSGLVVPPNAALLVHGAIAVNSEGGGVDEFGAPVLNGNCPYAAQGGAQADSTCGCFASDVRVVGGVDRVTSFHAIDNGSTAVLHARQLPLPDPMLNFPTPVLANGVDSTRRGNPVATETSLTLADPSWRNYIETNPTTGQKTMVLHPGIYESIRITGGKVRFVPGIYVIAAIARGTEVLTITSENVTAEGVMFYNTGNYYDPATGLPDLNDRTGLPLSATFRLGSAHFRSSGNFSPIDTTRFQYGGLYPGAKTVSSQFNGMLFYQRRVNGWPLTIEATSSLRPMNGTFYARWADATFSGSGTFTGQFVVGRVLLSGTARIELTEAYPVRAPHVFLVE